MSNWELINGKYVKKIKSKLNNEDYYKLIEHVIDNPNQYMSYYTIIFEGDKDPTYKASGGFSCTDLTDGTTIDYPFDNYSILSLYINLDESNIIEIYKSDLEGKKFSLIKSENKNELIDFLKNLIKSNKIVGFSGEDCKNVTGNKSNFGKKRKFNFNSEIKYLRSL